MRLISAHCIHLNALVFQICHTAAKPSIFEIRILLNHVHVLNDLSSVWKKESKPLCAADDF